MVREISIFSRWPHIRGWFTVKASDQINREGRIPGMNVGYHTQAPEEEVRSNRELLCKRLKTPLSNLVTARQIHKDHIEVVESGGVIENTDALITREPGILLGIQVADCAAILLADPDKGVVAALHAGWRGAAANIVSKTVKTMHRRFGVEPDSLFAWISPAITQRHFEVGEEVASRFEEQFLDRARGERPFLDLKGVIHSQLSSAGLPVDQIEIDKGCTWSDSDLYYSWRREKEKAGRMVGLIQIYPPDKKRTNGALYV